MYAATLTSDAPKNPLVRQNPVSIPEVPTLEQLAKAIVFVGDKRGRDSFYFVHENEAVALRLPSVDRVVAVSWKEQHEFLCYHKFYSQRARIVLV